MSELLWESTVGDTGPVTGQIAYTTPGTYNWVAPAGVTSVCVVAVGPGYTYDDTANGGSGGGLGWKNNIPVTPGQSYTLVVGASGLSSSGATGSDSYFISPSTVAGNKATPSAGGTFTGDGGGNGGLSGNSGGGGAGGYAGAGGTGGTIAGSSGTSGTGGSGGGGGAGNRTGNPTAGFKIGKGGPGGGVGLLGQGANGTAGANGPAVTFGAGQPGGPGSNGSGTSYGAGSGSAEFDSGVVTNPGTPAGNGAVRIIWGAGRAFPSTNTGDMS